MHKGLSLEDIHIYRQFLQWIVLSVGASLQVLMVLLCPDAFLLARSAWTTPLPLCHVSHIINNVSWLPTKMLSLQPVDASLLTALHSGGHTA